MGRSDSRNRQSRKGHHKCRSRSNSDKKRGQDRYRCNRHSKSRRREQRKKNNSSSRSRSPVAEARRNRSPSSASVGDFSDLPGVIKYRKGDVVQDRYEIKKMAGQGTFGTALYVYDMDRKKEYTMKVIRSVERYLEDAEIEIDILTKLTEADIDKRSGIVRLQRSFSTKINGQRHVCLIFEKLGKSLMDVIERNNYSGFTIQQVRELGSQLFTAIAFCHKHKLTHTDLKPDNILLVEDVVDASDGKTWRLSSTETRLIDFGGATFYNEHHASMIHTRQYRAPEVMLGVGWSYPSDIWSCGCILAELLTGSPLFQTNKDQEHFALMEKVLGKSLDPTTVMRSLDHYEESGRKRRAPSPESSHERGRSPSVVPLDRLFTSDGKLRWPGKATQASEDHVERTRLLKDQFRNDSFVDLLEKCLEYDPSKRLTAEQALKHSFFRQSDRNGRHR